MKELSIDLSTVLLTAYAVIGCIEWLKGFWPKARTWLWAVFALLFCAGFLAGAAYVGRWVLLMGAAMATIKFAYVVVVQKIVGAIGRLIDGVGKTSEASTTVTSKDGEA